MSRKKNGRREAAAQAFALALREVRARRAGLTQEKLNLDRSFVSDLERAVSVPSLATFITAAEDLHIPAPELMKVVMRHYRKPPPGA